MIMGMGPVEALRKAADRAGIVARATSISSS